MNARTPSTITRRLAVLALAATALGLVPGSVAAQADITGPVVSLDQYELAPGDRVVLTIGGFDSNAVTITVCGNEARRGSMDCNMSASEGRRLDRGGGVTLAEMPIASPPVPCPCVIRVSTSDNDQIAVAPITLVGHPVAPVVRAETPDRQPLDVSIIVNPAVEGFSDNIRSSLGGATTHEITVTVRNRTTDPLDRVSLAGSAGRSTDDELISLPLTDPGAIGPSQTWEETVTADLPAPVFGTSVWRVTASGAGPSVTATDETRHLPVLLIALVVVFVLDLLYLLVRLVRRAVTSGRKDDDLPPVDPDIDAGWETPADAEHRSPEYA